MTSYNGTPDIMTIGGRFVTFMDPRPEMIEIEDIAHALSHMCRFAGHTRKFYSVAEHSYRVSLLCPPEDALWGLLHDAAEAYITDLPRPIKRELPDFKAWEERLLAVIAARFSLPHEMPASVKYADEVMLATESRDLCGPGWEYWGLSHDPLPEHVDPMSSEIAFGLFLNRFEELRMPDP